MRIDCPPRPNAPAQWTSRPLSSDRPRCHRGVDPCLRNDLAVVPATAREDELADFRLVAWSQAQSPSGIGVALDPDPLGAGDTQGLEQHRAREFVEGTSGSLADYGRHERQRAGVVEELLSWRGRRRKTEDVTTRIWRHMHALLVVVALVVRDRLYPPQAHRHGERVRQPEAVLLRGTQVRQ